MEAIPAELRLREAEASFTEGEKYFILEDYAKSLYYFQRALELNGENANGENATIHYKVAEILAKGNKQDDLLRASISIENAINLDKKNKYFYILASTIYSGLNNFGQAEQALETMMKEVNGTDEYLYELAALYQYDHKADDAIKIYNRAENTMGINEVSSLQKQRLYFEQGKVNEAISEGQKLMDAFPDEERYVLAFAEVLAQYKQGAKAVTALESYLKDHPDNGNAKIVLAGIYHETGQEKKSQELILNLFDDPGIPVANKVNMLSSQIPVLAKDMDKPVPDSSSSGFLMQLFEKLEMSYPTENTVHTVGGDLWMALKKINAAEQEYRKAVRYGSVNFDAYQNLLSLELQQNKFDSIIVHTELGLELFPNQAPLYFFNGYAQLRKKHFREATSMLEQAKKLSASNPSFLGDINGMLGDAYNGSKDYAKSDKAYEDALALNPDNDLILNNYSYFLALRKENLEKAEKMSSRLVKNNPGNASYLDTFSWVLYMRGKYKEAKKTMEKALGVGNPSATLYEHYGDILFQLGDTDEAVRQWQKSKSLDSGNAQIDKKIANRKL
jgi:tetratricopeptide (TPR) repeat protein